MKQVVINIKEGKYNFFMELLKNFDFIQVLEDSGDSDDEIVANLTNAFKELKNYKEGKIRSSSAKEFLDEL